MKVTIIGFTYFDSDAFAKATGFHSEASDGQDLVEAAARNCYLSWGRPNPATATNVGYLDHILEVGHGSVLEHGNFSLLIEGVSRSLTHELVRHRHLSPSQLSQRYVPVQRAGTDYVIPELFQGDKEAMLALQIAWEHAVEAYDELTRIAEQKLSHVEGRTERIKRAREAARAVLPNMAPTSLVLSGNYRAWRHMLAMRGSVHADREIRALAVEIGRKLWDRAPSVFQDMQILPDHEGVPYLEFGYAA